MNTDEPHNLKRSRHSIEKNDSQNVQSSKSIPSQKSCDQNQHESEGIAKSFSVGKKSTPESTKSVNVTPPSASKNDLIMKEISGNCTIQQGSTSKPLKQSTLKMSSTQHNMNNDENENLSDKQLSLPLSTSEHQSELTKDMQQANEQLKAQLSNSNQQL